MPLRLTLDPGTERWAPRPEHRARIDRLLPREVAVAYHRREDLPRVWQSTHGNQPLPDLPPYAFRAYAQGQTVHLFLDDTETYESALWLLLHELGHTGIASHRLLSCALRDFSPRADDYFVSDDAHEDDFEEQVANRVADQTMAAIGLKPGYNRRWWRARTNSP